MLYEIWTEGYHLAECGRVGAFKIGEQEAGSFIEACDLFVASHPKYQDCYENEGGIPCYWKCRWFDNEADARKAFG